MKTKGFFIFIRIDWLADSQAHAQFLLYTIRVKSVVRIFNENICKASQSVFGHPLTHIYMLKMKMGNSTPRIVRIGVSYTYSNPNPNIYYDVNGRV